MPPQTRTTRANPPVDRIYESPALPQQVKFKPRRQRVYGRHSLGSVKSKRQETLTQIGFVNPLTDKEIDEEIEAYEKEEKTRSKRRKTTTPSSKLQTQTLTQLDFASTPKVECCDSEEEDEDGGEQGSEEAGEGADHQSQPPLPKRRTGRRGIITVRCIKTEPDLSTSQMLQGPTGLSHGDALVEDSFSNTDETRDETLMPPPKTPTQKRILEVPSSQSPATPLSTQNVSQELRTFDERSPLKSRSHNITSHVRSYSVQKLALRRESQISTQGITQDDEVALVPDSSPRRLIRSSRATTSSQSPSKQVLSEFTAASSSSMPKTAPRTITKDEIADSDADSDDELDTQDVTQSPFTSIQVPSSPDMMPGPKNVLSSSPLRRPPPFLVQETIREETQGHDGLESQWTRSQLLPDSLMQDSFLPVPPILTQDSEWDE